MGGRAGDGVKIGRGKGASGRGWATTRSRRNEGRGESHS